MSKRKFYSIRKNNLSDSNLTELNAADAVDKGFMSHSDWVGHVMRYGYAMKTIEKKKPLRILDVGCGNLNLAKFLWRNRSSFHGHYVGLDLRANEGWLNNIGSWNAHVSLYRMDIVLDDPTIIDKPFDVVTCFEMFEHVPKKLQPELLRRLYSWTSKNGVCLFSTPNAGVAKSTADNHVGSDGIRERKYTDKLRMLNAAGFIIENSYGTFCGSTRLPHEFLTLPHILTMKEFMLDSFFVSMAAINFPSLSNNSLQVLNKS